MAAISLGDLAEILDAIDKMGVTAKDNKSTSRTKKYILEGDNRLELSSKIHEMLDRKRIKYSSAVKSGSGFPATIFVVNGDKVKGAMLQYKEPRKKAADAKTTAMQEKASTFVFERVLKDNITWPSVEAMMKDKTTMNGIKKVYPSVEFEWLEVFWKQHVTMFKEFSNFQWHIFDHSGTGSFMDYITDVIVKKFGISKKDNWDPADMWLIKGSVKKITDIIDATIDGSKGSQTIEELNTVMRSLYKERKLVGVSLKKVSGSQAKWEEFNVRELTLDEIDDYNFPDIETKIMLTERMTQDSVVKLTRRGKGYKFQIKANNSTGFSNLKWEATQIGAGAARGGKAQVDLVVQLLKDAGQSFEKANGKYPQTREEYLKRKDDFESMFDRVKRKAETGIMSKEQFSKNIEGVFIEQPYVANSKLIQLAFLDAVYKITPKKKQQEVWTDIVFLAIKKGNKFGPFGKLY
tara:strand:+ start:63 stop:1451 length:1389 start_codon:yes stop_codon:yes gene_type:complete